MNEYTGDMALKLTDPGLDTPLIIVGNRKGGDILTLAGIHAIDRYRNIEES